MGTPVEITAFGCDHQLLITGVNQAFGEFERLERLFNVFDPDSLLSQVNCQAAIRPVAVTGEWIEVVSDALALTQASQGWFSILLAPLIHLWKQAAEHQCFPTDAQLEQAKQLISPNLVDLNRSEQTVSFRQPGVGLDLGGFVKGYAVDRACKVLIERGIHQAAINAGTSSWALIGQALTPSGKWSIAVRHPLEPHRVLGVLVLSEGNRLSTSGTAERTFEIQSHRFSHLIDPHQGFPLSGVCSATVMAPTAAVAEVASKILLFLGCQKGIALCDQAGWEVEGMVVTTDSSGESLWIEQTGDFPFIPPGEDLA